MTTSPHDTIRQMTGGLRTASASAFLDAVTAAELAPRGASIDIEVYDKTAFAAHVVLPHTDERKLARLHRWLDLVAGRIAYTAGQGDTDDIVRLDIRALSGRRRVIITTEFSRQDEAGAIALINFGRQHLIPAVLVAYLISEKSERRIRNAKPRPLMPQVRARMARALARLTDLHGHQPPPTPVLHNELRPTVELRVPTTGREAIIWATGANKPLPRFWPLAQIADPEPLKQLGTPAGDVLPPDHVRIADQLSGPEPDSNATD